MIMWNVDKFLNPEHAAGVFENFYGLGGLSETAFYVIGAVQLAVVLGFLLGLYRTYTYAIVLALHAVSTLSSFRQYFDPFSGPNLLFFAAWPMLAALLALFLLRKWDTLLSIDARRGKPAEA